MAEFLLIHGSCHGAWCWRDVIPRLVAAGHTARAIDLPSHGADTTSVTDVTLDSYADAILAAIDRPVVLVGHSMAGYPISAAAEKAPEKIARLIYLCAYAPVSGMSLVDMRRAAPRQPLLDAITLSPDGQTFSFNPDKTGEKLYHDCTPADVAFANAHLGPQPVKPQATPIALNGRYASVPRSYIRCAQDQAIPPEYQTTMTKNWPAGSVTSIDTSHSPFLSDPDTLVKTLLHIIEAP